MIAFELYVNNKRISRAGIPGQAVLTASLTWVKRRPPPDGPLPGKELSLHLGGLDSNGPVWADGTHLRWKVPKVRVGDTIKVRILEADKVDTPTAAEPAWSPAEMKALRERSRKMALAHHRRQRKQLDREIRKLEKKIAR